MFEMIYQSIKVQETWFRLTEKQWWLPKNNCSFILFAIDWLRKSEKQRKQKIGPHFSEFVLYKCKLTKFVYHRLMLKQWKNRWTNRWKKQWWLFFEKNIFYWIIFWMKLIDSERQKKQTKAEKEQHTFRFCSV